MDGSRGAVMATVLVVGLVSVAAGPLVDVDLAPPPDGSPPGAGTATARVESVPDTVRLDRSRFAAGTYHLSAPAAVVAVDEVRGNPLLKYAIDIPALGLTDINTYALAGRAGGDVALTFRPFEVDPDRVTEKEYRATLAIWLVTNRNEYAALHQETITIRVERRGHSAEKRDGGPRDRGTSD